MITTEQERPGAAPPKEAAAMGSAAARVSRSRRDRPAGGLGFDWAMTLLCGVFLLGLFLDGWAHTHGWVDDTFFTPRHAVLYSGYLATAAFLVVALVRNRLKGFPWLDALPAGYELSLVGVLLWGPGGASDLIWHEIFGFEVNVEALLSPPHLLLAVGAGLIFTGPLRAAWHRPDTGSWGWGQQLPMLLSLTYMLSLFTFFTQIAHPIANLWGRGGARSHPALVGAQQELGVVSLLLSSGLLMGVVLLALRRWSLPVGSLTLVLTLNAVAVGVLYDQGDYPLVPVAALAVGGVAGDLLLLLLRPSPERAVAFRIFAFALPAAICLLYFLALMASEGVAWSVHLWTGSVALTGVVGWLLSYLPVPPRSVRTP